MTAHLLAAILVRRPQHVMASALRVRPLVAESANRIELLFGDGLNARPPQLPDNAALWKRLDAADRSGDHSAINDRDWRDSPWCGWQTEGSAIPLFRRPKFARHYCRWIKGRRRQGDYRRLVQGWLLNFDRENPSPFAATLIVPACTLWPDWLWARRHASLELFDADNGPANLASQVLDDLRPVREVLRERGLGDWLQTGGYAEAAFAAALGDLPRRLQMSVDEARGLDLVRRILDWAESSAGDLQFPGLRKQLVEALLIPWQQAAPPKAVERTITSFLLKTCGDPRMQRARWNGVDETATNVFKRWLTGATLEAFVRVIERVAEKDHWKYRKAFWMGYYRAGHILDAWVALGPDAERIARQIDDLRGQSSRLVGQCQSNHCVLLLRIGNLVVADWSHNGKCRVWRDRQRHAPLLYRKQYDAGDLRVGADIEVVHQQASAGGWQRKIHDHICDLTGIRLSPSSYMP
jgi:hypothetical protein